MTASINVVTLNDVLTLASQFLGETSVPTTQNSIRTNFANSAKDAIANIRNWTWELTSPAAELDTVKDQRAYALPTNFKNKQAMYSIQVSDGNSNPERWPFYAQVTEEQFKGYTYQGLQDQVYYVNGNFVDGYTVNINPAPASAITGGIVYRYYKLQPDFSALTDTVAIPQKEPLAWYVAQQVLYGYREQAQAQLAQQQYEANILDMTLQDMKMGRNTNEHIKSYREALGRSTNYRTYYSHLLVLGILASVISSFKI